MAQNYNPCQETSVANVADAVEQYLEWKAFACWFEPLSGARTELPKRVATQLERRCPGFPDASNSASIASRSGKVRTGGPLMTWIEDHFFSEARKKSWFDIILKQARTHARYARLVQYSKRWNKTWPQNPKVVHPSFAQWRAALLKAIWRIE